MAFIRPDTTIWLIGGCELSPDYKHTFLFKSKTAQSRYFTDRGYRLSNYNYTNFSDNVIRIGNTSGTTIGDEFLTYNYMMFKNYSSDNRSKTYYAFIINAKRIGNNCIEYTYQIDVMQTYWFDFDMTPCFVEREHVLKDDYFAYTLDENISNFNMRYSEVTTTAEKATDVIYLYVQNETSITGKTLANVYSACDIGHVSLGDPIDEDNVTVLNNNLRSIVENGGTIIAMFQVPNFVARGIATNEVKSNYKKVYRPSTVEGYTPKNKKLFSYPFLQLEVTNNQGESKIYKPEQFPLWYGDAEYINFVELGSPGTLPSLSTVPEQYSGVGFGMVNNTSILNLGLSIVDFPLCSWLSDTFTDYWVRNKNSYIAGISGNSLVAIGSILASLASGGTLAPALLTTGVSAAASVNNKISNLNDVKNTPDNVNGCTATNSINNMFGRYGFTYQWKHPAIESAIVIDNYFTQYGYRVDTLKIPNVKNYEDANLIDNVKDGSLRPYWNFIKTNGAIIHPKTPVTRGIPSEYEQIITKIFDNGITFWLQHDIGGRSIGDYDKDNSPRPDADPWSEG